MASKLKTALLGSLIIGATAFFASAASAAPFCPANQSFFGTIERVNGNMLTVRTPSNHWADIRIDSGARVNNNGTTIHTGAFVGAYGCVTPNGVFHANEITLAPDQAAYNVQLSGVVASIQTDALIVNETGHGQGRWFVPDTDEYHVGQTVNGLGMEGSNGEFYVQTINGRSVAYDTDYTAAPARSLTLTGTVKAVRGNELIVWQPSNRTTGTWIVRDTGRFRAGQRVSATGTEDRTGRFYVQEITIL